MSDVFSLSTIAELLPYVYGSLIAGAILGLLGGVIGPMIQARDLAFAVHGASELSFAGGAAALLFFGTGAAATGTLVATGSIVGSVIAAILFGLLGFRARDRNSAIGVILPFGLGLGVLFLALYPGRSANKFGLLVGQIVAVDQTQLWLLVAVAVVVLGSLAVIWRPLFFASVDPEVAAARGVPVRFLAPLFMLLLGLTVAMAVQIVGALLVLSLLITPTAAAVRVTASPAKVTLLSVAFAMFSAVVGIILSLTPKLPVSPCVTTVSFLIYLVCRLIGSLRARRGWGRRTVTSAAVTAEPVG
ncbi:metal ABC transporter permease [Nakamurella lactea]|uniref:metal ABC transporter permease n=1 Tax=Nakamurella lactea TaxID=459515 RepID=UPI00040C0868|nr:metal ABC transporter permease [Nakamurella lactea]